MRLSKDGTGPLIVVGPQRRRRIEIVIETVRIGAVVVRSVEGRLEVEDGIIVCRLQRYADPRKPLSKRNGIDLALAVARAGDVDQIVPLAYPSKRALWDIHKVSARAKQVNFDKM